MYMDGNIMLYVWPIIVLIGAAGVWILLPYLWRIVSSRRIQDCVSKRRTIVLTYDDGPSEVSKELLDLLAKTGTKATFFATGGNVDAQPTIAQAII
jgi:peptidoglycan/xylan/chitin deacetylase (PgdA/CDA1 family)